MEIGRAGPFAGWREFGGVGEERFTAEFTEITERGKSGDVEKGDLGGYGGEKRG
jgi:hypothetical protein